MQFGQRSVSSQFSPPASVQATGCTSSQSHWGQTWRPGAACLASSWKRTTSMVRPLGRTMRRTECWFEFWFMIAASLAPHHRPLGAIALAASSGLRPDRSLPLELPCLEAAAMLRNPTADLLVVLLIVLLFLGPKRLPTL